jgi:hypothetical protein
VGALAAMEIIKFQKALCSESSGDENLILHVAQVQLERAPEPKTS